MFEDFTNALHNFKSNKMRTFLSLIGIIIGVTSVIIITTLSNSLKQSVLKEFSNFKLDVIYVYPMYNEKTKTSFVEIDDDFRQEMLKEISGIKNIFFTNQFRAGLSYKGKITDDKNCMAVEYKYLEAIGSKFLYGKSMPLVDFVNGYPKAILGNQVYEEIFNGKGNPVGQNITILVSNQHGTYTPYSFEIAGVLEKEDSSFIGSTNNRIIVPLNFAKNKLNATWSGDTIVQIYDPNEATRIGKEIQNLGRKKAKIINDRKVFWVDSPQAMLKEFNQMFMYISIVMSAIAGISLLVGGIGIMNIMLVTVTERKKEIGIRKALGATTANIRNQFLVESASLTLTGGLLGIFFGVGIAYLIVNFALPKEFIFGLNWAGNFIAFLFSVSIGIIFGLSPAIKASKLDPIIALAE